jgi:hypothetical protein|nr:MAG TPA: hypothetical protein [Inoviridae sp.]
MTIKDILKIASNDDCVQILIELNRSFGNDCYKTEFELKNEIKMRKNLANQIKGRLENQ